MGFLRDISRLDGRSLRKVESVDEICSLLTFDRNHARLPLVSTLDRRAFDARVEP